MKKQYQRLLKDTRLQAAAGIARMFRIDPVMVLKANKMEWLIRMAATDYIVEAEEKAKNPNKVKSNIE